MQEQIEDKAIDHLLNLDLDVSNAVKKYYQKSVELKETIKSSKTQLKKDFYLKKLNKNNKALLRALADQYILEEMKK